MLKATRGQIIHLRWINMWSHEQTIFGLKINATFYGSHNVHKEKGTGITNMKIFGKEIAKC